MSRFKGWDIAAINKINGNRKNSPGLIKKTENEYVNKISQALDKLGIQHVKEYKFLHDRRFRFDIAIIEHKIAIEWEGGIFAKGRHVRGIGYAKDTKKYNLAVMHDWKLLRYTTEDAKSEDWADKIAEEIKKLIHKKISALIYFT